MKRKKRSLTILVIPHNDSAPITLSFPRWLAPLLIVIFLALLCTVGYLAVRYQQLTDRYDQLVHEQQSDFERSRGMRATILTQQDDVKSLSDEVKQIESEIESIRKLSDQVRQLLNLPPAPPPPLAQPTPTSFLTIPDPTGGNRVSGNAFMGGAPRLSMGLALEMTQQVETMRPVIPWAEKELQYLANEALKRLAKVDPSKNYTQAELQAQLKLLEAAPSQWPVRGRITSDYGWRKALFNPNAREFHTGIDIAVWYFTPVKATKEGTVIYAGWMDGYGNTVEIAHEMGYVTLYGHNYEVKVRVGQQVKAGDVIARSGQTGYANGPHVHYEVRFNGKPLDPMRFLDSK